jgi:hypothetical protein
LRTPFRVTPFDRPAVVPNVELFSLLEHWLSLLQELNRIGSDESFRDSSTSWPAGSRLASMDAMLENFLRSLFRAGRRAAAAEMTAKDVESDRGRRLSD